MPPRKAAAAAADDNATADPPRRSGRIASQPVTAAEANPKPKAKATKKRTAGDEAKDGEGSTTKKVLNFSFFFRSFFLRISILILL
jgi:peroxiredoxin Q/BCP